MEKNIMFADWKNDVAHVKKSFGALGKKHPKMLQAYQALGAAAAEGNVLDAKTRELIALAVAVTTRCESCIGVHAEEAVKEELAQIKAGNISQKQYRFIETPVQTLKKAIYKAYLKESNEFRNSIYTS